MIGILIVTHRKLGEALLDTAEFIIGRKPEAVSCISIDISENAEKLRAKIAKGIKQVKGSEGVLILTDMFGGTPSNLSYSFLEEGSVEVISGVNLPMFIKAEGSRKNIKLSDLAESIESYGRKSISMASGLLKGNKRGSA